MWQVEGTPDRIRTTLEPDRLLYEYDGPRIFTSKDSADNLYLAYFCDEDERTTRFLVVTFSERLLDALTAGSMNVRDALTRPQSWLVDLDNDWQLTGSWRIDVDTLPTGVIPEPGVMLWRHLTPVINPVVLRSASWEA